MLFYVRNYKHTVHLHTGNMIQILIIPHKPDQKDLKKPKG